jgi:hypothetical protein
MELQQVLPLNELLIIDQDSEARSVRPFVQAARESGHTLPVLVVVSENGGEVVKAIPAPDTIDGVLEELADE